jgi:hypothetical protein
MIREPSPGFHAESGVMMGIPVSGSAVRTEFLLTFGWILVLSKLF